MNRFQEFLMKDIGWKLLSVAIAAIMWFMVINITQPVDTRNYSRPLAIQNMEALSDRGLTVGNLEELKTMKVTVKVKAQRTALDRLSQNPEWIQASVDLSELSYAVNGDIVALPISVSVQGGNTYGISSKSPSVVEISVETMANKEMPVEVKLNGTLEEGTYLSEPTLSAETVTVSGPASLVNRVSFVRAAVDAEVIAENPTVQAKLLCYDSHDTEVSGVMLSTEEITVSYALHDMKQVPIQVELIGTPAVGYQVTSVFCSPQYAAVTGAPEDLENLIFLQMDSIIVNGLTSSVTETFSLQEYLPEGISLAEEDDGIITVTVQIEAQSHKQLTLPGNSLTILGQEEGKTYSIHDNAHITITGENLESIHGDDLQGTIHVNGLSEGEHRVLIHVDLPDGMILNPSYITVIVKDVSASAQS